MSRSGASLRTRDRGIRLAVTGLEWPLYRSTLTTDVVSSVSFGNQRYLNEKYFYMWGDLMEIEIIPVPDDKELSAALDSAVKWIAESLTASEHFPARDQG